MNLYNQCALLIAIPLDTVSKKFCLMAFKQTSQTTTVSYPLYYNTIECR